MAVVNVVAGTGFHLNTPPSGFSAQRDLPAGFIDFLRPLHERFTSWQQELVAKRKQAIEAAHRGHLC